MLPLEGLEHFSLDGTEYEAFNTSGGLGTLCETLAGQVRNARLQDRPLSRASRPDVLLLDDLALNTTTETLKDIMRAAMPATMQDVVLVFVTVSACATAC